MGGHHHHFEKNAASGSEARSALRKTLNLTAFFFLIEFAGGWISNSLALIGDAVHMLTDVGALGLSLFAAWLAARPPDLRKTYGYRRAEILAALFSGLMIWFLTGMLIFEAFSRMESPPVVEGPLVIGIGALGLLVNLYGMKLLHSSSTTNINVRGAYLHVMGDLLGSICAIVSGVVIWRTGWFLIDPILTLVCAGILLVSSWKLVREALGVLMEFVPKHVDPELIRRDLESLGAIDAVHDLHIWSVTAGEAALSVHLVTKLQEDVLPRAQKILEEKHQIRHSTIQVERPEQMDMKRCGQCEN